MRVVVTAMGRLVPEHFLLVGELSRRFDTVSLLLGTDAPRSAALAFCGGLCGVEFGRWSVVETSSELQRKLAGADAVVHLPPRIEDALPNTRSVRKKSVDCVIEAVSRLERPATVLSLVPADEVGEEEPDEVSVRGAGAGVRFCTARLGVVLRSPSGPLERTLCALRTQGAASRVACAGLVGWIHVLDAARAIAHVLDNSSLSGRFNLMAPDPISVEHFATSVWAAFGFPLTLRRPASGVGRLLSALPLVEEPIAAPRRLVDSGFSYLFPDFTSALADITQR